MIGSLEAQENEWPSWGYLWCIRRNNSSRGRGFFVRFNHSESILEGIQQGAIPMVFQDPPDHSKHNRIERCWGILENHWNRALLDSLVTTLAWAKTMTWRGVPPIVQLLDRVYETGVRLTPSAFRPIARRLQRSATLPKSSLVINPESK